MRTDKNDEGSEINPSPLKGPSKIATDNLNPLDLYRLWEIEKHGSQEAAAFATTLPQTSFSRAITHLNAQLTSETGRKIKIYNKKGGRNTLSEEGEIVYEHAKKIVSILFDLPAALGPKDLRIAMTAAFPKYLSYFLLREILVPPNPATFTLVHTDIGTWAEPLLDGRFDLVLTDQKIPQYMTDNPKDSPFIYTEGDTHPVIVADPKLIKDKKLMEDFPHSLNNMPFVMPPPNSTLHMVLVDWFAAKKIKPNIIAKTNDRLLMVLLAQKGAAVIGISSVVSPPVCELQNLQEIHHIKDEKFKEKFIAVTHRRHENTQAIKHICQRIKDFSKNPPKPDWGVGRLPEDHISQALND